MSKKSWLSARFLARAVLVIALIAFAGPFSAGPAAAHNQDYAVVKIDFAADGGFTMEMHFFVPAFLSGQPQGSLAPAVREMWEGLPDEELARAVERATSYLLDAIEVYADDERFPLEAVTFPDLATLRADGLVPAEEQRPSAPVMASGRMPPGTDEFTLVMPLDFASALVSLTDATGATVAQVLPMGLRTQPFHVSVEAPKHDLATTFLTLGQFAKHGFDHIFPRGLDHILFVLSLFLLVPQWRALALQVTAFTAAHSVTLALSVFGLIAVPKVVVEPLIALSIAVVALDNVFSAKLHRWRTATVFGFGLLHGIGFANALKGLGLPTGEKALALVSFNVGVELGQLAILVLAFMAFGWFRDRDWYRGRLVVPASLAIAAYGAYWTVERLIANL